uniref:Tail terminator n=1 Tax=Micrococcus phage Olihed TaxID=3092209 RepID=A0AAU6R5W9_9CAUD
MVMSTQILAEAARQLAGILIDEVQILDVSPEPVTVGFEVTRPVTPVGDPVAALVQTTTLANAVESKVESIYSVKFHQGTVVSSGQAIRVTRCVQEPDLVGKVLLLDKVSQNGGAIIRKAVASDFENVNQEGKEGLA